MGIIASEEKYFEAVKSLYPQGIFFEKQFEDKNSDLSKIARCQAKNIYEFKKELNNLWLDSRLETCTEDTIEDYERTLSGIFRSELTLEERKSILLIQSKNKLDIDSLNLITQKYYTANILSINEKLEPSVFGYARFGQTRIFNYRSFIVVMISLTIENPSKKNELEAFLETMFMANKGDQTPTSGTIKSHEFSFTKVGRTNSKNRMSLKLTHDGLTLNRQRSDKSL